VCAPNGLASIRVGFVVSKRITKRAVERNYLKRLLTEAIRPYLVDIPAGWDIIISAKHSAIGVPLPALVQDVRILLRRARLLDFVAVRESQG
jgi:ribonuclease P protein component